MRRLAAAAAFLTLAPGLALAATQKKKPAAPVQPPAPLSKQLMKPELSVPSLRYMMLPMPKPDDALGDQQDGPGDPNADVAYGAYQRGMYRSAFDEAKKRAEAKPPQAAAMTLLGQLYADGAGVARSLPEAARWYGRAVALGDREAMLELGLAKLQGSGIAKDPAGAAKLFETSAALGEPEALYNLAILKLQGGPVPQDAEAAARAMKSAAELGQPDAQYAYAILLKEGRGVERDPAAAAMWLSRAAAQNNVAAMVEYAIALFNGAGAPKDEAAAAAMFRRAAGKGNAIAQNRLARLYAYGRGVDRDPVRAAAWHRLAREQGLNDAWLEGFAGSLPDADRDAADKLVAKWTEGFGPVAQSAVATAPPAPQP